MCLAEQVLKAVEDNFRGELCLSPKEVGSHLQMAFLLHPSLQRNASTLAQKLADAVRAHHYATSQAGIVVLGSTAVRAAAAAIASGSAMLNKRDESELVQGIDCIDDLPQQLDRMRASTPPVGALGGGVASSRGASLASGRASVASPHPPRPPLSAARGYLLGTELYAAAEKQVLIEAAAKSEAELLSGSPAEVAAALWRSVPPVPLDSRHPQMIMYTSGTGTGAKPKGLVHDHGGFSAGAMLTMESCFDVRAGEDAILVRATPAWIPAQTYGISGALCTRATSVIASGPLEHAPELLATIVRESKVTIFVHSASFLKRANKLQVRRSSAPRLAAPVSQPPSRSPRLAAPVSRPHLSHIPRPVRPICHYPIWTYHPVPLVDLKNQAPWFASLRLGAQLRVAASCGEPLTPALQRLAMRTLCPHYINTYWGTEHGALVLAHAYGNRDQPLRADGSMFPLPWVGAELWVQDAPDGRHRAAATGERGVLVCTRPWPSMSRTVWGDAEGLRGGGSGGGGGGGAVGGAGWVGDLATFAELYYATMTDANGVERLALTLGDLAQADSDGAVSVLGRRTEMLRVRGVETPIYVVGIENTLMKQPGVIDCLIVPVDEGGDGGPEPVALLIMREGGDELGEAVAAQLKQAVHLVHGEHCVPVDFVLVSDLPRTCNSRPMRQVVCELFAHAFHGDISEISNPSCLMELSSTIANWRAMRALPILDNEYRG